MKWGLGFAVGVLLIGFGLVSTAGAANNTYYATPTGGATTGSCGRSTPCTFAFALSKLGANDTLILLPGTYQVPLLGASCSTSTGGIHYSNATITSLRGRPRPILDMTHCQHIDVGNHALLQDVNVIEPSSDTSIQVFPIGVDSGGTLDGITDQGPFGPAVDGTGTVENSFVSGVTFLHSGGVAINDTVNTILVQGYTQGGVDNNSDATVINTIAKRFWAFSINQDGSNTPGATAHMTLSYFVGDTTTTPPNTGGASGTAAGSITASNQVGPSTTALHLASDGLHETANSPTLAAGSSPGFLPLDDFDGGLRAFNGTPDIGADQFGTGPPILNTLAATNVKYNSASLHGTINTNEIDNPQVRFLWGPGSNRTHLTVAHDAPAGVTNLAEQQTITGLAPSTTYSFLIESGNEQLGQVVTFHTPKKPAPFAGVVFEQHSIQVTAGHVAPMQLFCPASTSGFCKGILTLSSGATKLGSASFLANHGNLFTVRVKLTTAAFNKLVLKRTEAVRATAAAHDVNNTRKTTGASITLKAPPK